MTPRSATPPPRSSFVARFGPLAVILVALGLVAWMSSTGSDSVSTASGPGSESKTGSANASLPIYYQDAEEEGDLDQYDWGDDCDPETGRIKVPSLYAPPCVAARPDVERNTSGQGGDCEQSFHSQPPAFLGWDSAGLRNTSPRSPPLPRLQ